MCLRRLIGGISAAERVGDSSATGCAKTGSGQPMFVLKISAIVSSIGFRIYIVIVSLQMGQVFAKASQGCWSPGGSCGEKRDGKARESIAWPQGTRDTGRWIVSSERLL